MDQIDHAIAIGKKYHQSIKMVTLEGELISPGGAMTGGAYKNSGNLLGRKREIDDLTQRVEVRKKVLLGAQSRVEEIRASRAKLHIIEAELGQQQKELSVKQNTVELKLSGTKEREEAQTQRIARLQNEISELVGQIAEIEGLQKTSDAELSGSEALERDLTEKVRSSQENSEGLRSKAETLRTALTKLQEELAVKHQQGAYAAEQKQKNRALQEKLSEEAAELNEKMQSRGEENDARALTIRDLHKEIDRVEAIVRSLDEKQIAFKQQRSEMNQTHRGFFDQRDALEEERRSMDQEFFRLTSQQEKYTEKYDRLVAYLWDEYQLTPDDAKQLPPKEESSISSLRTRTNSVKKEIRELGSVNVGAIAEYKELKERHDFLSNQHADLMKASQDLKQIIKQLDEGMRRQFETKFKEIQKEFNRVFKELFGGGTGTLTLVEGEDILEAGILINAQPPGKKLQNMMQLSGGEKALTAISILFAIQNLKPSPFCLLDEIEAALDDSNVTRYAEYLHKLTKSTQFIIITHRRGSMAAADRLYGITMQEKGVSTLVSVDLIESDLDE